MRPADEVIGWFRGRIPVEWFTDPVDVDADREEILLTGRVTEPPTGDAESPEARGAACLARVKGFREDTREHRVRIASEAEAKFGKKVSWATRCGDVEAMFTNASVPVMTRLRMPERSVLDTLIDAGVAAVAAKPWRGVCGSSVAISPTGSASCAMRCSTSSRCGPRGPRSETSVGECGALLGGHRRDLVDLVGAEPGHFPEPTGEDDRGIAVFATAPAEVEQRIDRALELERRRTPIPDRPQ